VASACYTELAGGTFLTAGTAVIRIESIVDFAPGTQLPVAVDIVDDAFAYSSSAVTVLAALVVAFPAVVVVELEVHAHIVTEILSLCARVVVVTTSGK
jgi:hypothetical protein